MNKTNFTFFRKLLAKSNLYKENFKLYILSLIDSFVLGNNFSIRSFKKVIFSYTVYGDDFIDAFLEFSLPSILQNKNIPLIFERGYEIEVIIFTSNEKEREQIIKNDLIIELKKFAIVNIHIFSANSNIKYNDIKLFGMYEAINKSIIENAPLFWVAPDDFYGDGSLSNLISLVDSDKDFIFSSHPRVKWSTINEIKKLLNGNKHTPISNRQLVKIAMENLVDVQRVCFDDNERTLPGVSLKKIHPNVVSVKFSRIAPVFGGLYKSDLNFFKKFKGFNYNDFLWSRKIQKEGRMKLIGDSDIFFKIELTHDSESKNDFKKSLAHKDEIRVNPYGGKHRLLNHKINEMFISFWKQN